MLTKTCPVCGNAFSKNASTSLRTWNTQTKFCSHECYWIAKKKPPCVCEICGKEFKPVGEPFSTAKYCSRACFGISCRNPLPLCEVCGKPCKKHGRRFCSQECSKAGYRGEKVYNYVGENFRKDSSPIDYAAWMKVAREIRERDRVCSHCGKTPEQNGRALDVHHIVPFRISHSNSPSNLIALCRSCHKKADSAIIG